MSAAACKLEIAHVHVPAHVRTRICAKCAMCMQAMWLYTWLQLHMIEIVMQKGIARDMHTNLELVNMLDIKEATITNNKHTKQNSWAQNLLCFQQNKPQQCTG